MATGLVTINVSGGDTTLVEAPGSNAFIRVLHYHISAESPVTVSFKSDDEVIDICYATTVSGGWMSTPYAEGGVMACNPGEPLVISLSGAADVGGVVTYVVKPGAFPNNT